MLWAVLDQPSPFARVQTQPLSWLGCPARAKPQHHGDKWHLQLVLLFHYLFQAQPWWPYITLNSTKLITDAAGCFRRVSVGAGTEQRGMDVSLSRWKLSSPWHPSTCSALKVALSTPQEMPQETTTDSSKCQILLVLFLVRLQPAKPAWLQRGGHLQLSTCQHTHRGTHHASQCQDCALFQEG